MKRIVCIALILVLGGAAFAQTTQSLLGLVPKNAKAMGMGGSFRLFAEGYDTFFGNPAGFASKYGSLTILDTNAWLYFKPTQENLDKLNAMASGETTDSENLSNLSGWIVENGFGAGAAVGLGWAGKGFGLGVTIVTDEVVSGNSLLGSVITSQTEANAVVGLAFPFRLGPVQIKVGADARAFYTLRSNPLSGWPFSDLAMAMFTGGDPGAAVNDLEVFGGYGFAFDGGATVGIGPLTVGAMVRNYGLEFAMDSSTIGQIAETTVLPMDGVYTAVLTPVITAGAALRFNPDGLFSPSLYVEADDPLALVDEGFDGIWNKVHAGAEIDVLKFIALRAGLNKGWISFGAGIDLIILELDAALFTEELGAHPGDFGRTGIAIQAAVRF